MAETTQFWKPLKETVAAVSSFHYFIEAFLVAVVVYLLIFRKKEKKSAIRLTEKEKDELIAEWNPDPLVPDVDPNEPALKPKFVDGKMGKYVRIEGKEYLNVGTTNFQGFVGDQRIEEIAKKTIFKYGVGSCGPRGFYGTVDVHLDLEKELAEFLGCEEAVLYSYGFATIASAIPAYAKKGDIIFADKACNFAIQKGLQASRSRIEWFEHNNVEDLERLLKIQAEKDKKDPKTAAKVRRFMVVEGLYNKTGDICPLKELLDLKWKYKVRIFIDESFSFGVLGKSGKGVTEHFGIDIVDVDMIMASLENAMATTGGFCAGRSYVVGHQRLSGLGYCFSASLPPLLATAASEALRIIKSEPERLKRLHENAISLHNGLKEVMKNTRFEVIGVDRSPMKHVIYHSEDKNEAGKKLDRLLDGLFEKSIMGTRSRYLDKEEIFPCQPSVKIMISAEHTGEEIATVVKAVQSLI